MGFVARFCGFWYDFIVGDDWRIAAGVLGALLLTAALVRVGFAADWLILPVAAMGILSVSVLSGARNR